MKALLVTLPGFGHICPTLPLLKQLQESGHDVAVASSPGLSAFVDEAGIQFFPIGPHWHESEFHHDGVSTILRGPSGVDLSEYMHGVILPAQLKELDDWVGYWRPDVILSNDYEISGRLIAEKQALPFVLLSSGPRLSHAMRMRLQGHIFAKARGSFFLSGGDPLDYSLRWLHLCFVPSWYRFDDGSSFVEADNEYGICPEVFDGFSAWGACDNGAQSGTVALVTLGTVFDKRSEIFQKVIDGVCRRVDTLLVLASERTRSACQHLCPENVRWVSGSLSNILRHVDVTISHGGTSTLTTSLRMGKPGLIIPQGADQIINAIACTQNNLGVSMMNTVIENADENQGRLLLTPQWIGEKFSALIESGEIRKNCGRFKESVEGMPAMADAVGLIERLVETGLPVVKSKRSLCF